MRLKLHISPCPNDTFMFDALVNGRIDTGSLRFEVEYHDIEELNRGAGLGRADISKISCAVLPAIAEHYALLDSGAALGRGNGPLLVRRAGDTRPIRRVAVPGLHTTANALMGKLFPEIEERTPLLFSRIAAAVERGDFDAGVLIHEGRFVYRERELELVADLGSCGNTGRRCRCRWAGSQPGAACRTRCGTRPNACCAQASNTPSHIPKLRAPI